jgi:hypothetical protein
MRHSTTGLILGVLLAVSSTAAAQTIPGVNTPFGGLARTIAGIDVIKAQIADLRRQLSGCDGPGASKAGACAARALIQAKLNYLLEVSMMLGDPDTAGAPPVPLNKPTDASDYEYELSYLQQQLRQEPGGVYILSENRTKYWIILHCKAMKDLSPFRVAYMTPEEAKDVGGPKTKAAVVECIKDFDAKAVAANRKTAFEYCVPATTEKDGGRPLLNVCMHKHDMLQAMCKQELELQVAWAQRKNPQGQHAPQMCPLDRILLSPGEVQAIMAATPVRTMAELPPKFFASPNVVVASRPTLPIPTGTVIEVRIQGTWDGSAIDSLATRGTFIPAMLDEPLIVNRKTVLGAHSGVHVKGRIIGRGARADTVQIGLTIDEVNIDAIDCRVCGKYADLPSNELVFTVPYQRTAQDQGIPFDTKLRFTTGVNGTVEMPSTQTQTPSRPAPVPAPTSPTPTPPPPTTPSPQSLAEDARKRGERIQACLLQAAKDHPPGNEQAQAMVACASIK